MTSTPSAFARQMPATVAAWLCALALPAVSLAQALVDPTLPPASIAGGGGQAAAPADALPRLQMILRPERGAATALIDGRWLRVGDALPGRAAGRVLRIDAGSVMLTRDGRDQTLELLPAAAGVVTRAADPAHSSSPTASPLAARRSHR